MDTILHSADLFKCYWWQNYTTVSNTYLYLSYFDLSYGFSGHNDSVQWGLTVIRTRMNLCPAGFVIWNHCVAASLHRPPSHRTMMYFSWNWGGIKLPRKPRKFSNEHLHKRFYNFLKFFYSLLKSIQTYSIWQKIVFL